MAETQPCTQCHDASQPPRDGDAYSLPQNRRVSDCSYVYTPLSGREIRLLEISTQDGHSKYHLEHVALDKAPSYTALSYCWGDPTPRRDLLCDGLKLPITDSVRILLPYLAPTNGHMYLWLDALCINQQNVAEKNMQVEMMGNIYKNATEVIIWLGEGNELSSNTMKLIPSVIAWSEESVEMGTAQAYEDAPDKEFCDGIHFIFARPWFTRVWTLQEAILASRVKISCGWETLAGELLTQIIDLLCWKPTRLSGTTGPELTANGKTLRAMNSWARIANCQDNFAMAGFVDLPVLLYSVQEQETTLAVDKIYAILGLACPEIRKHVSVNYDSSYADALLDFVAVCFKLPGRRQPKLLNLATGLNSQTPSWCPNLLSGISVPLFYLSVETKAGFKLFEDHFVDFKLLAGGSHTKMAERGDSNLLLGSSTPHGRTRRPDLLQLHGFLISTVSNAIPFPVEEFRSEDGKKSIHDYVSMLGWETLCLDLSQETLGSSDDLNATYYRTLTCKHVDHAWDDKQSYEIFRALSAHRLGHVTPVRKVSRQERVHGIGIFTRVIQVWTGRSFFSTSDGRIGAGPAAVQPGDKVYIFHQTHTPFIVRPTRADSTMYSLVGEVYVDGLMEGEAFALEESKRIEIISLV